MPKILLIFAALATLTPNAFAQKPPANFLRGLNGVSVRVQVLAGDERQNQQAKSQLQTDVELRLRTAGIPVMNGMPSLNVNVFAYNRDNECSAAYIEVELTERASLQRDPSLSVLATTWHHTGLYTLGPDGVNGLRGEVKDLVDQFANDYLAANPKK